MKIALWTFAGVYLLGLGLFFWVNLMSGPVTPGLSLLRAAVWPIWITTGWPEGERQ